MLSLFLKTLPIFFLQSLIFYSFLSKKGEENGFIWDLYLASNSISVIIAFLLHAYTGNYFPVYFLASFLVYYLCYFLFYRHKAIQDLLLYYSINIYVIFFAHLLFASFTVTRILFLFLACALFILLYKRGKLYMMLYLLPILYFISLLLQDAAFYKYIITLHISHISEAYTLFSILLTAGLLLVSEVFYAKFFFLYHGSTEKDEQFDKLSSFRYVKKKS